MERTRIATRATAVKSRISFRSPVDFRIHEEDGRLNRRRGTSAVVDNGGQSHISPVSRCSRLLITREFRPRTRVINGSGPRVPGTAGQSYERTYRSPISILISWRCFHKGALLLLLLLLSSLCRILPWYNTMNLEACITLSRLFALAGISNQIILKSTPRNRQIALLLCRENKNFKMSTNTLFNIVLSSLLSLLKIDFLFSID